jgi:hypothetical protein
MLMPVSLLWPNRNDFGICVIETEKRIEVAFSRRCIASLPIARISGSPNLRYGRNMPAADYNRRAFGTLMAYAL